MKPKPETACAGELAPAAELAADTCHNCGAPIGPRDLAARFDDCGNLYCDRACRAAAERSARLRFAGELAGEFAGELAAAD